MLGGHWLAASGAKKNSTPALDDEPCALESLSPDVSAKLQELSELSAEAPDRIIAAALNLYELALLAASRDKKMAVVEPDQPTITEVVGIGHAPVVIKSEISRTA